jgi:hypothetical protein
MFFEVSSPMYHSPVTIAFVTYGLAWIITAHALYPQVGRS